MWAKILSSLALSGTINESLADLLISIIEHTEHLFESAPKRQASDYSLRKDGELDSQHFPNFPLIRERATYEKKCNLEDEISLKNMCEKVFPSHSALSPGLMLMTCACPKKVVYMVSAL